MRSLQTKPSESQQGRAAMAAKRAVLSRESLAECRLCAYKCAVNRLKGERGLCHAGAHAHYFSAQTEVADELVLVPTFAIALSGCEFRCDFCILAPNSWHSDAGNEVKLDSMAEAAKNALNAGAKTIMILGGEPAIHLPDVLELVARLPDEAVLVWKTNAHSSQQANHWLEGMFNIWNADYKFGNDACAERLAKVPDYTNVIRSNLIWAHKHTRLIVRHLAMPGHIDCCWTPIAEWLARTMPDVEVNLRTGFWPAWRAANHKELCGTTTEAEAQRALQIARDFNLTLIE